MSRRDDLECLGYMLMYFMLGKLPWQGLEVYSSLFMHHYYFAIKATTVKERYEKIREMKLSITADELCKGYPSKFCVHLDLLNNF